MSTSRPSASVEASASQLPVSEQTTSSERVWMASFSHLVMSRTPRCDSNIAAQDSCVTALALSPKSVRRRRERNWTFDPTFAIGSLFGSSDIGVMPETASDPAMALSSMISKRSRRDGSWGNARWIYSNHARQSILSEFRVALLWCLRSRRLSGGRRRCAGIACGRRVGGGILACASRGRSQSGRRVARRVTLTDSIPTP